MHVVRYFDLNAFQSHFESQLDNPSFRKKYRGIERCDGVLVNNLPDEVHRVRLYNPHYRGRAELRSHYDVPITCCPVHRIITDRKAD